MKKIILGILSLALIMSVIGCAGGPPSFESIDADSGVVMPAVMFGEKASDEQNTASFQFDKPKSLAVDLEGNIYVGGKAFNLTKFTADGEFIAVVGEYGEGKGQWKYPKGLAVNSNNQLVIADAKLSKVLTFEADGTFVAEFGVEGEGEGQFEDVGPCAVDADNNIYVSDDVKGVMVFDAAGNYKKILVAPSESDNGTTSIGYIAVDSEMGRLIVADDPIGEVDIYDLSTGEYILTMGGLGEGAGEFSEDCEGVAAGKWGLVFAVDENSGKIHVYQQDGTHVTTFGNAGIYEGEFASAEGIAYDAANNRLVVADEKNYRVQSFSLSDMGL